MDSFQERYEVAVEYLLGSLLSGCGMAEADLSRAEKHFGVRLPPALRGYYLGVGRLHQLNDAHDRLLAPKDWFLDGGKLVFRVENQAVLYWGVEATRSPDDDPPVFQGVNRLPEPIEWHPEHPQCSAFLLLMLHWQAVAGGFEWLGMADARQEAIRHFEKHWRRVGAMDGMTAFRREGQAACFIGEDDALELYVGARSEEGFERIASELKAAGIGLNQL